MTKALEHLLAVLANENGFGFIDAEGNAQFRSRHNAIVNTTLAATLADGRSIDSYPGAIPYVELHPETTDIVNDYKGKRDGGTVQYASDADSIVAYGPRSEEITFLLADDNEVAAALEWKLSITKDPRERIDSITVMPGTNPDWWATVVGLEIGDRILVVEWPPGYLAPVETEFFIRHMDVSIPASYHSSTFTFQLTAASTEAWLVLDDETQGRLDYNKLAY